MCVCVCGGGVDLIKLPYSTYNRKDMSEQIV